MTPFCARVSVVESTSVMSDLCQEVCRLRNRAAQVVDALRRCQNPGLRGRLARELDSLSQRRCQLHGLMASLPRARGDGASLMRALLLELCRRPLAQQL